MSHPSYNHPNVYLRMTKKTLAQALAEAAAAGNSAEYQAKAAAAEEKGLEYVETMGSLSTGTIFKRRE